MTTPSPLEIYHTYLCDIWNDSEGGYEQLDVESITATMDVDRLALCEAEVVLAAVTDQQWAWIDPRQSGFDFTRKMGIQIKQWDMAGNMLGKIPSQHTVADEIARLWIRSATRDRISGRTTVRLAGGESMLEDRRRNSGAPQDTGAATVSQLVQWSLIDTFGSYTLSVAPIVIATTIPAGERRQFYPGESHIDLLRPELDAINCRIFDVWGVSWTVPVREATGPTIKLATYTQADGAPADVDGIITSIDETVSRDGGWADAVLIKYDNTENGGTVTWSRSSAGVNTKGLFLTFDRGAPAGGDAPAQEMEARARRRGLDYVIEARCRLDVVAGSPLELHLRDSTITGLTIRSVEWRPVEGTMTIRAQTGDPLT